MDFISVLNTLAGTISMWYPHSEVSMDNKETSQHQYHDDSAYIGLIGNISKTGYRLHYHCDHHRVILCDDAVLLRF